MGVGDGDFVAVPPDVANGVSVAVLAVAVGVGVEVATAIGLGVTPVTLAALNHISIWLIF